MKTINCIFIIGILCLSFTAKAGVTDYVMTSEGVKFYEKVRHGLTARVVGVEERARVRYNYDEIVAYRKDGRIYERMPVISGNKETGSYAFMELLAYRNGMKVYRHNSISIHPNHPGESEYLVFRDGNYVVSFTENNSPTLKKFFFRPERLQAIK